MTDDELKTLAKRVMANEVYLSWGLKPELIPFVFMPLMLMDGATIRKELEEKRVCTFWAPMADAMPRSINGQPIFSTVHCLDNEESQKLRDYLVKLEKAQEEALK